jgi:hypothetical protein
MDSKEARRMIGQIGRDVACPVELGVLKKLTTKMASKSAGRPA